MCIRDRSAAARRRAARGRPGTASCRAPAAGEEAVEREPAGARIVGQQLRMRDLAAVEDRAGVEDHPVPARRHGRDLLEEGVRGGHVAGAPVSYTHLDVYKRQGLIMKIQGKILLVCAGAISLIAIIKTSMYVADSVVKKKYSSYSEVVDDEAIIHGMAPDFLPRSATKISAVRDLNADTLQVEFSFGNDFDGFLSEKKKARMSWPIAILDETSLSRVDVDRLQVISNFGSRQECASHLVVDMQTRIAIYIYNFAPHKAGCLEKAESL